MVIELSRDGGASFSELASGLPARDGAFAWTVSGPPAGDCVVRIIDAADADPVGLSGSFAIVDAASDAGGNEGNEDGCGCRIAGAASARAWLLLLLAVGLGRRRWRC